MATTFFRTKGGVWESSKVIGCKVENANGENLGKIESLMLDLNEGRILYAVLSFGGFLGVGDKLFPIPTEALTFHTNEKGSLERCVVDISKDKLRNAPGYSKSQLPDANDRGFASKVYSHYGYTPYWSE